MMAYAQKPDFVFPRNGRVHLNRWGRQFSQLLAAEVCPSAWIMLDRPRSEVAWEYWLPTPFASFPFTSPPARHRVPPGSERALHYNRRHVSSITMLIFRKSIVLSQHLVSSLSVNGCTVHWLRAVCIQLTYCTAVYGEWRYQMLW